MFTTRLHIVSTGAALGAARRFAEAGAIAIVMVGGTALPGPASAAPPMPLAPSDCDWIIFDTDSVVKQDNGIQVHIAWGLPGSGTASYTSNGVEWQGPVQGGVVKGTNKLDFSVPFKVVSAAFDSNPAAPPTNHYTGTIGPNGSASGTTVNNSGVSNGWTIDGGFKCIGRQAAPPAGNQGTNPGTSGPPPVQCSDGSTVPAGQTCPVKPVTNAITVSFDGTSNTAFRVTVKNSSSLPARCDYRAVSMNPLVPSQTTRTFDVPAKGSTTESFDGLKTGSTYQVTMKCADSSGTQTELLGDVNQTVKW